MCMWIVRCVAELHLLLTWKQVLQDDKKSLQTALSSLARSVRMKGQRTIQAGREEIIRFLPQVLEALLGLLAESFESASIEAPQPQPQPLASTSTSTSLFFPSIRSMLEFSRGKPLDSFTSVVLSTLVCTRYTRRT